MADMIDIFPPARAAALERLQAFAPKAGQNYGEGRNFAGTATSLGAVSGLSPYLRTRMISQVEVLEAVLSYQTAEDASRFVAEVFWRSYWQGWLALRPSVWDSYQSDLGQLQNDIATQSGLRQRWQDACTGQIGIAPFDAWAHELAANGYLHNHVRMWFASIWVHTLKLPWQLGADFFLRHLLDGCPASNTLGWKWVAGIQTIGKPYLATSENIAKYTDGRFENASGLADSPADIPAPPHPDPQDLWRTGTPQSGAWLLHEEDLNPVHLIAACPAPTGFATLSATAHQTPWQMAPMVTDFRAQAMADAQNRFGVDGPALKDAKALADWAQNSGIERIITADAPVGPTKTVLDTYDQLGDVPPLIRLRRDFDAAAWPLATKGFFKFRKHIPDLLDRFVQAG